MVKYIIDFLKEKNKSKAYICAMIILVIGWGIENIQYRMIIEIIDILKDKIISIVILCVLYILVSKFLKYVNLRSEELVDNYNKPIPKSIKNKYIKVTLIQDYRTCLQIEIENLKQETIKYIKGSIYIYKEKYRMQKIDFEFDNLLKLHTNVIFSELDDKVKYMWDAFNVFIYKVEYENELIKNVFMEKAHFIKTYFMILNLDKFYDFKILGVRTKYNIAWLKEELKMNNKAWIAKIITIFISTVSIFIALDVVKTIVLIVKVVINYI